MHNPEASGDDQRRGGRARAAPSTSSTATAPPTATWAATRSRSTTATASIAEGARPLPRRHRSEEGQGPRRLPDRRRRSGAAHPQLGNAELLSRQRRHARPGHAGVDLPGRRFRRAASTGWSRARHWSPSMPTAAFPTTPSSARGCCRTSRTCAWLASCTDFWSERAEPGGQLRRQVRLLRGSLRRGTAITRRPSRCPASSAWTVDKRGPAEVFVGKLDQPGKEKDLLTAPRGLAVARGLLYVADPAANRVVGLQGVGSAPTPARSPSRIRRSSAWIPASGAVYVCAYTGTQTADLIKFSGLETARSCTA